MAIKLHHIRATPNEAGDFVSFDIFETVTSTDGDGEVTEKTVQSTSTDAGMLAELNKLGTNAAKNARKAARKAAREAAAAQG